MMCVKERRRQASVSQPPLHATLGLSHVDSTHAWHFSWHGNAVMSSGFSILSLNLLKKRIQFRIKNLLSIPNPINPTSTSSFYPCFLPYLLRRWPRRLTTSCCTGSINNVLMNFHQDSPFFCPRNKCPMPMIFHLFFISFLKVPNNTIVLNFLLLCLLHPNMIWSLIAVYY